tara:strand:- start:732 stop:1229 length:498 start_codon:yes stop_codon:yes gene_type:complete
MSFESKLLYEQYSATEDGASVLSTVYAILWTYPGAMTKTSARVRTTFIYQPEPGGIIILGGTIEKWRSEGWGLMEEYLETRYDFLSLEECRDRLLNIAESFLTGTPLQDIDETYFPEDPGTPLPTIDKNKKPDFKVIEYEEKKSEKSKSKKNKAKPKKEPDFDWI